jgi:3-oxoacyl-[acyl-carrier protein] reductase
LEDKILKNIVSLISGAGRGIGKKIAQVFAENGSNLILISRTKKEIDIVAEECRRFGIDALAIKTDISSSNEIENCVKEALDHFGKIDILVNNAGGGVKTPVTDFNLENWKKTFDINFFGTLQLTCLVLKNMIKNRRGNIINVVSRASGRGTPYYGAYCASKAALLRLTESISYECRRYGIRVNSISPARVAVERVKRDYAEGAWTNWIKPEEIADIILFLASDLSRALNGVEIRAFGNLYELATYDYKVAENAIDGIGSGGKEIITW